MSQIKLRPAKMPTADKRLPYRLADVVAFRCKLGAFLAEKPATSCQSGRRRKSHSRRNCR